MPLAEAVLLAHLAIILFNLFGLVAVPLGAACGWRFVHIAWWRVLHVVLLAAVAAQAALGRACILTIWQDDLAGAAAARTPLIAGWIDRIIYWPLPLWVFAVLYLLVFGYALALLWLVPLHAHTAAPPEGGAARRRGVLEWRRQAKDRMGGRGV